MKLWSVNWVGFYEGGIVIVEAESAEAAQEIARREALSEQPSTIPLMDEPEELRLEGRPCVVTSYAWAE